jgi:hypothetical protein
MNTQNILNSRGVKNFLKIRLAQDSLHELGVPRDSTYSPEDRPSWMECILFVLKDGVKMTSKEIHNAIETIYITRPWIPTAKTPSATCSSLLLCLYKKNKLGREGTGGSGDSFKYYM